MTRVWLVLALCSQLAVAGSDGDEAIKTCVSIVQAVDASRWQLGYSREQTIASFDAWAEAADRGTSSLRLLWYEQAVRALIDSGYAAQERAGWHNEAMQHCLTIAAGAA